MIASHLDLSQKSSPYQRSRVSRRLLGNNRYSSRPSSEAREGFHQGRGRNSSRDLGHEGGNRFSKNMIQDSIRKYSSTKKNFIGALSPRQNIFNPASINQAIASPSNRKVQPEESQKKESEIPLKNSKNESLAESGTLYFP